jgi:prolyl oligopeptidase PreP (S9A serine peptidase family)
MIGPACLPSFASDLLLTPNGEFNITEFGTVADPDMFRALLAYSPYHNVRENFYDYLAEWMNTGFAPVSAMP